MLGSVFQYSYINAKIHALKGNLLQPDDYKNLLHAQGLHGLIECLKSTPYGKYIDQSIDSYEALSLSYFKSLLNHYSKLINHTSGNHRLLVYHLYQRYEMENLKVALRTVCYDMPKEKAFRLLLPLTRYQTIFPEKLLESKDLFDLIQQLKGTWYFDPLDNAAYRYENEGETFPLEMALDLYYYERLWKIASSLRRHDQKIAKGLIGIRLDGLNILWIIRFKESYHFSPEEILNYSLINGSFINQKRRKILAYSIDQKDILNQLKDTPYYHMLNGRPDPEVADSVLLGCLLCLAKKNWRSSPFQIGTILDYLIFKEIEVRNLKIITEGKNMGFPVESIKRHLDNTMF